MTSTAVIFDLDGTLVDPAGAITEGIASALSAYGLPRPAEETLDALVGPPLASSLASLEGVTDELIPSLIAHYRAEYLHTGMASSQVYPGIPELLTQLNRLNVSCVVATSKPEPMARRLLQVQGLSDHFFSVHGSDPDETVPHSGKGPIIGAALESLGMAEISPDERQYRAVMVGDRVFDVLGAADQGLQCWGVRWGFAPEGELEQAGAAQIYTTAQALLNALEQHWQLPGHHETAAVRVPHAGA